MHRGVLHYAYDIARTQTLLAQNAEEAQAVDLEFDATAPWQYAIDPATLQFNAGAPAGGQLPSPVFDSGLPPFTITAAACPIDWPVAGDTFVSSPPTDPVCTGPATNITLWPYGVRVEWLVMFLELILRPGDQAADWRVPNVQLVNVSA